MSEIINSDPTLPVVTTKLSFICTECGNKADKEHLKCVWCRTIQARKKQCTVCKRQGQYKAKGLCNKCYMQEYRKPKK